MIKKLDRKVQLLGVGVTGASKVQVLGFLEASLELRWEEGMVVVTTPNSEQVVQAQTDDAFRAILNESDVALPDGSGLVIASKILKIVGKRDVSLGKRIAGREVAEELLEVCVREKLPVFFLGGTSGAAEEALVLMKAKLAKRRLKLIGAAFEGARDVRNETDKEREMTIELIRKAKPKVLLVAYGAPWQEKWVWEHKKALEDAGVRVAMVVGGAFDVWSGRVRPVPSLISSLGFEWLWRLLIEPWRWRRQLRLLKFSRLVVKEVLLG